MFELTHTSQLWLYFVLVAGIIALPGMDMAFVMAASLADGRRAGLAAVAGIMAGGGLHLVMASMGVSLLLAAAPQVYAALLVAGALYLGWIGIALWRGAAALAALRAQPSRPLAVTFGRAVLTCLLNPKAYLFMLAVFPQFLRPEYGSLLGQSLALGLITATTQAVVYGAAAWGAGAARDLLGRHVGAQVAAGRAVGALLMAGAAGTLWQGWPG